MVSTTRSQYLSAIIFFKVILFPYPYATAKSVAGGIKKCLKIKHVFI